MLEVTAKLPGRCVFLAGEPLECRITFTNTMRKKKDGSPAKYVIKTTLYIPHRFE